MFQNDFEIAQPPKIEKKDEFEPEVTKNIYQKYQEKTITLDPVSEPLSEI